MILGFGLNASWERRWDGGGVMVVGWLCVEEGGRGYDA